MHIFIEDTCIYDYLGPQHVIALYDAGGKTV